MAKNNESLNNSLFQLLRSRGYNPTLLGTDGKEIPVPDEAEVFQFHFIKDDKDYGPVTISIDGLNKLVIYYNDAIASSPSEEGHSEDTSWFTLLNHLKRFSQGHQLSFELKNTDHLKYDMAKRNNMKKIDEAAKWRQGYSASGHPAGHKHKSGEVGPIGGTFTNEPAGYDGDTKKVPVQKYRDKEDELSGRAATKLSTSGKPLLPKNAQRNLKGAIKQSAGKHGPVGALPEGRFVKGPGGVPLDRQGNAIPPKEVAPQVARVAKPKMDYDKIWFDVTNIISNIFPDGDPADYLPKYCRKHGLTYDDIRKAARKNGYKDEYEYIDQMKTGDYGYEEPVHEGYKENQKARAASPVIAALHTKAVQDKRDPADIRRLGNMELGKFGDKKNKAFLAKMGHTETPVAEGQMDETMYDGWRSIKSKAGNTVHIKSEPSPGKAKLRVHSVYLDKKSPPIEKGKHDKQKLMKRAQDGEFDTFFKKKVDEGYYATGRKSSYSDAVPQVKIILQHSRQLEEGERRYRAIERIFVENAAGERFLLDTTKPGLARVYARHIAEGGTPYDEQGKHIHSLCEEYTKMAGFVRATRNGQFNESTQSLVNEGVNHYNNLRETLHKMAGRRGYNAYFESWTPTLTEDEDSTDLSEMFASTELDPRIESVMPILRKLNKNITEVDHSAELAEWADDVIDESLGLAEVSNDLLGRYKKKAGEQATVADKAGNFEKGHKRFKGIVKATLKQFANDKPKQVAEGDGLESNNPEGIPEATNPRQTQPNYPDTKQGAAASFAENADERFVKEMDLPNCKVWPDPQTEGVWAIDNYTTGVRVIVYLAGYRGPMGDIRGPYDDFEEGQIPKREMMRHQRNDQAMNDVEDDMMEDLSRRGFLRGAGAAALAGAAGAAGASTAFKPHDAVPGKYEPDATPEIKKLQQVINRTLDLFGYGTPFQSKRVKEDGIMGKETSDAYKAALDGLRRNDESPVLADKYDTLLTKYGSAADHSLGYRAFYRDPSKNTAVKEELGPEQKKVGQAGPTDKAPLRGKLVGACESVDHLAHIVKLSKG